MRPARPWHRFLPSRLRRGLSRMRALANRHPRRSAALLLSALALQTTLVFLGPDPAPALSARYRALLRPAAAVPPSGDRPAAAAIPFTLSNYRAVRDLLDTLEYLRARPVHSRDDTLRFLRVLERYARLDTAFAGAVARSGARRATLPGDPPPIP